MKVRRVTIRGLMIAVAVVALALALALARSRGAGPSLGMVLAVDLVVVAYLAYRENQEDGSPPTT